MDKRFEEFTKENQWVLWSGQEKAVTFTWNYQQKEIDRLKAELEEAREDIVKLSDFYGDENNWSKEYIRQGHRGYQVKLPLHKDGGKRARAFNEKYKRGNE